MSKTRNRQLRMAAVILILAVAGLAGLLSMGRIGRRIAGTLRTDDSTPVSAVACEPYSVSMSPVGTVRFTHPPERIVTQDANYNDMLEAVGYGGKLLATGFQNNSFDGFYNQLSGIGSGTQARNLTYPSTGSGGMFDKELLYSLHADIHHIDPLQLAAARGWSRADVEEISRNVAPFFANRYSRDNIYPGKEPYEFYTIWELSDKVAQVYLRPQRIAYLKAVGDKLVRDIGAKLPPREKRPEVGLIYYNKGRITPYGLGHGGFGQAQYVAVGARDAFGEGKVKTYGESGGNAATLDVEGLLAINPDVIIMPLAIYGKPGSGQGARGAYEQFLKLRSDPLCQRLSAFQHNSIYPGGTPLQGPVFYLFQIEMAAKQIYPDIFGPYRDDQRYPPQEQLFDRNRVAEILNGKDGARVSPD